MSRIAVTIKNIEAEEFVYQTLALPTSPLSIPCTCASGNPFNVTMHDKFHNRTYIRVDETNTWQEF